MRKGKYYRVANLPSDEDKLIKKDLNAGRSG